MYAQQGLITKALQLAEQMRERSYLDLLGDEDLEISDNRSQELYAEMDSIISKVGELEFLLRQSTQKGLRGRQARELKQQLTALRTEYANELQIIRREAPELLPRLVRPLRMAFPFPRSS